MKIGIYQFSPEFGHKEKNLQRIEDIIQTAQADLIVLPELCTTGYQFIAQEEVEAVAEPIPDGPTIRRFIDLCGKKERFLVAGMAEKEGQINYNSAVLIGPEGFIGTYRKVHLFWDEQTWFKPGDGGFRVWDIGIARIGMASIEIRVRRSRRVSIISFLKMVPTTRAFISLPPQSG